MGSVKGAGGVGEEVVGDVHPDEVEAHFDDALEAARNDAHAPGAEPEDQKQRDDRDEADQHDAVDLERRVLEQEGAGEELRDRRSVELTIFGSKGNQQVHSVC